MLFRSNVTFLLKSNKSEVEKVTIPSPPNCMRIRIINCPNRLQCSKVLTTTSPVTHTEVVEVKSASMYGVYVPSADETGSISITEPMITAEKNPRAIIWVVDKDSL